MNQKLASYAIHEENSLGRVYPYTSGIEINDNESIYAKDTRRILHSESFNRLRDKTQVFPVTDERTNSLSRMTHSLQVAQLSSDIASVLNLNTDISYTLGLLHDIGHAPFGHLGQDVLNELMQNYGGFEHNFQAIRIVDLLERNNPGYNGLNLTFEVREGLLKHCSQDNAKLLEAQTIELNKKFGTNLPNIAVRHLKGEQSFLEAQLVNLADSVSYLYSDMKDAFRNRILTVKDIFEAPSFKNAYDFIMKSNPSEIMPTYKDQKIAISNNDKAKISNINDYMSNVINIMYKIAIKDLVSNSKMLIADSGIQTLDDIRVYKDHLVTFTDSQYSIQKNLKTFSRERIYRHPKIHNERFNQAEVLVGLFNAYMNKPEIMIGGGINENESIARNVCDNISGMTDKFALYTYKYLKENSPELVQGKFSLPKNFEISPDKQTEKKRLKIS